MNVMNTTTKFVIIIWEAHCHSFAFFSLKNSCQICIRPAKYMLAFDPFFSMLVSGCWDLGRSLQQVFPETMLVVAMKATGQP